MRSIPFIFLAYFECKELYGNAVLTESSGFTTTLAMSDATSAPLGRCSLFTSGRYRKDNNSGQKIGSHH